MTSLLITQCLQNDFVKPLKPGEPLPNMLHVGHEESRRLIGDNPESGPIKRFMSWATREPLLSTIHIRDWHDPTDPIQANHLQQFGQHCIKDSEGAAFIFTPHGEANQTIINSTTLNDFEETALAETLQAYCEGTVRVGLIGVWTEAKILFLAYELSTRYPNFELAVCSALTASSSRSQHFLALQQLDRIVGVTVIDSIGEFVQFLGGEKTPTQHRNFNQSLKIHWDADINLDEETDQLIRYLFRDCQNINLKVLDGGFSGNLVAGVNSTDAHGHTQTPHVIKIGPRAEMAKERTAFEQIERVLGNNAPAIAEYADGETKGAIKYRYASMGSGKTRSLQQCFQTGESLEKLHSYLDTVFDQQLGRLYRAAITEKQNLLHYYCFDSQWADSVKHKIRALIGNCPDSGPLTLPGGTKAPNLYQFYKEGLGQLPLMVGDYPFAFVHGDLNGANVIIDERDNVWLIDFFHTHRGHVLKDFAKLENDLLYIYTQIKSDEELQQAFRFTDFLMDQSNPLELPESLPKEFAGTAFEKAYASVRHIREKARQIMQDCGSHVGKQWLISQLRYAVHTIGFDEPNERQRVWALYSACQLTDSVMA
ncbi:isochorismatase family protein [Halioxenophilus aromaticivorans]|uniref:Aminoglycoside phosphotransferase domain-containing protein n=1 Tax=Halioxenophilus aromaticivorans TaxID=1306992 RepID=A0AAV3UAP2_9ALTE